MPDTASDDTDHKDESAEIAAEHDAAAEPAAPVEPVPVEEPAVPPAEASEATAAAEEAKSEGAAEAVAVAAPAAEEPVEAEKPQGESWGETIKTVVYALLIALVIRTFFFQLFNIPSGSMINTLLVGDYLFVEKYAYGFSHYSFPFGLAPFKGRVFQREPERGDVIVFKMPNKNSENYEEDFIKRLIGLPGDRIQMKNGQVVLNGRLIPKVYVGTFDYIDDQYHIPRHAQRFQETLPNGKKYFVLDETSTNPFDNTDVYVVPPGHYFMMGDNRDNSNDSRIDVGYVPAENLVGKAEIIFYSYDGTTPFWQFWNWPWEIRYDRLFTWID